MNKTRFSLHTHTFGFDGANSVEEMVIAAQKNGYTAIGFSNHFIVYPDIENSKMYKVAQYPKRGTLPYHEMYSSSFEYTLDKFQRHYENIEEVKDKISFPIYKGMEVDFFTYKGWNKNFEKAINILKPDYIIGSTHFSVYKNQIMNMHDVLLLPPNEQKEVIHKYWENTQNAIRSGYFDFMAHLDLYKRHGLGIEDIFKEDEEKTASCLAEHHVSAEINTGSLRQKKYDTHSLISLLQLFVRFNIATFLSDDAHCISDLSSGYDKAQQIADSIGVKNYCRPITKRKQFYLEKYYITPKER